MKLWSKSVNFMKQSSLDPLLEDLSPCKRLLLIHFICPSPPPNPSTIGESKMLCQALRYTGKLGMADLVLVEITGSQKG